MTFSFLRSSGLLSLGMCTVVILLGSPPVMANAPNCHDTDAALNYWRPIRNDPQLPGDETDLRALEVVSCLGSPNAELRDRIAYELLTTWLRGGKLRDDTRSHLLHSLSENLQQSEHSATLSRSFSALMLAEVMRSDAVAPFMSNAERQTLLEITISALQRESDYRGFDKDIGWIHPVAHMSDVLWRFSLHPATNPTQALSILEGIRAKIAPIDVSYQFNESDRLARVVATIIRREMIDSAMVATWLIRFSEPQSNKQWASAFQSVEGMRELHNTKQFIRALSDQLEEDDVAKAIDERLRILVAALTDLV